MESEPGLKRLEMRKWRLILSGHNNLYANMAADEALLESYVRGSCPPTLRIYGWEPMAFSLGYSQDPAFNFTSTALSKKNLFVRRITGGGVLFHNQDISYSVVASPGDLGAGRSVILSFKIICSFLVDMYKNLGLDPKFALSKPNILNGPSKPKPNFCLASKEKYDIVINGRKLGGNAQKRRKSAVLQHGSIPIKNTVDEAKEFLLNNPADVKESACSLDEVIGRPIDFSEVESRIVASFEKTFSADLEKGGMSENEKKLLERLKISKYSTIDWNYKRITKGVNCQTLTANLPG